MTGEGWAGFLRHFTQNGYLPGLTILQACFGCTWQGLTYHGSTATLIPGWGGGERLLRLVGHGRAIELAATTRVVNAHEAVQIGLANHVFAGDNLLDESYKMARQIIVNQPQSVAAYKELFRQYDGLDSSEARQLERKKFIELWDTETRRAAFRKVNEGSN